MAAAVSGMLALARVPSGTDLLLPRRPFYPVFSLLIEAGARPWARTVASWLALGLTLAAGLLVLARFVDLVRHRKAGRLAVLAALLGLLAAGLLARSSLAGLLDVLQNAWFPPESLDILEPLLAFLFAAGTVFLAARAGLAAAEAGLLTGSWMRAGFWALGLVCWWLGSLGLVAVHGGRSSLAGAAGIPSAPSGIVSLLVLTEGEVPDYSVVEVPLGMPGRLDYSEESLAALERLAGRRSVHRLSALRHVYTARALACEAEAMREAAFRALEHGDPLAGLLLLGSLSHAPATAGNRKLLEALADEGRWRVGSHAAFLLSDAFSRFGDSKRAEALLGKASQVGSGIPAGLLAGSRRAQPARIRGRFLLDKAASLPGGMRLKGMRVSLYRRDRAMPPDLSAMTLSASTLLDRKGGFEFKDMPAGGYSLALVLGPRPPGRSLSVSGHKGDVRIAGKDVVLAPITLRF
jgi:hypothetical protein